MEFLTQRKRERRLVLSTTALGTLFMITAAGCWGIGLVLSKAALAYAPPLPLLVVQLTASAGVLWALTALTRTRVGWSDLRHGWTGVFEPGLAYTASIIGLTLTSAGSFAILSALEPFFVLAFAALLLREAITRRVIALMGLAVLGTLMIGGEGAAAGQQTLLGDALVLLGVAMAALYVVFSRRSAQVVAPLPLAAAQQAAGLLCVVTALVLAELVGASVGSFAAIGTAGWALAVVTGVLQYAGGFTFYILALKRIPASRAAGFLLLTPVYGLLGAAVLLGELPTLAGLLGSGLILSALFLLNRRGAGD